MKIHPSGNVSIGTSLTNNGYRLEVTGNSRIQGSSTSTGTALIVSDSSQDPIAKFQNTGELHIREVNASANPDTGDSVIGVCPTAQIIYSKNRSGVYKARSYNTSTSAQSGFSTDSYITGSNIIIPSWGLQAGTSFLWKISLSKTAAGVATPILNIRIGTGLSTSDTSRLTLTGPAQTADTDTAVLCVMVTVRSVGASGVIQGTMWWSKNSSTAGFANNNNGIVEGTSSGFTNTGLGGNSFGLSINGGTSASWTITQVQVEANW